MYYNLSGPRPAKSPCNSIRYSDTTVRISAVDGEDLKLYLYLILAF